MRRINVELLLSWLLLLFAVADADDASSPSTMAPPPVLLCDVVPCSDGGARHRIAFEHAALLSRADVARLELASDARAFLADVARARQSVASAKRKPSRAAATGSGDEACAVACVHGHCHRDRCLCSPDQWRPNHRTRYWENVTYVGARCHHQVRCDARCRGLCVQDECICVTPSTGAACESECVELPDVPHCPRVLVPSHRIAAARAVRDRFARADVAHVPLMVRRRLCRRQLNVEAHVSDCDSFSRRVRVAYLITVHDTRANSTTAAWLSEASAGLGQLDLLLRALWSPDNVFAIHVEPTSSPAYLAIVQQIVAQWADVGNVLLVSDADRVVWSGMSVVDALLRSLRTLLQFDWDVFVNLSGADFPIKSAAELQQRLRPLLGRNVLWGNYVAAVASPARRQLEAHVRDSVAECRGGVEDLYKYDRGTKPPFDALANAHLWMVLERNFCEYLVADKRVGALQRFFRFTRVPDEKFFLTTLLDSQRFRHTWLRMQTRFMQWIDNANHPLSLTNDAENKTFHALLSSEKLFARKFSFTKSKHLLARLFAAVHSD
jgi:hypothetical protein